ncbi:pentapeptide repeat-containing protein [Halomonas sp. ATBC28]|uniref:pentapeptide repeat-containing protein n=1 Tax=Halomonas sp. ATBC28 TaxID=2545264 RepID=UPI00110F1D48|nr:pentapeptide repeat-containing protein [Halomonas sp. ATBC28]TMU14875.1 pentapeptide repeat-containing protein [Halomonas sp. ATBC28]
MTEREQQKIARINELSVLARNTCLALLAYLGYVGITLLAVQDADFFVPARQTELPLVGIAIPTFSFFVFAPPLGAALYIYQHIHLIKLFDTLAVAPARIDGEALGDRIHPWLVNNLFLTIRAGGSASDRPLNILSNFSSLLLVWITPPMVLAGFWWRSMSAHDERLTLFLALSLLIASYAGLSSWWAARSAAHRTYRRPWPNPWRVGVRLWAGLVAVVFIIAFSWLRTEGGFTYYINRTIDFIEHKFEISFFYSNLDSSGDWQSPQFIQEKWVGTSKLDTFMLAQADLFGVELVVLPESWRSRETTRDFFREDWCRREGLSMAVCGHFPSVDRTPSVTLQAERESWCGNFLDVPVDVCLASFDVLNERFEKEWTDERSAMLASLPNLDLIGRDLRDAYAPEASLVNASLELARLQGAILISAKLEGADLSHAQLNNADLSFARLEGATFWSARMEGVTLHNAWMEGANFTLARLNGGDLSLSLLENANFFRSKLNWVNLMGAHLEGANLQSSQLEGANLTLAKLEGGDFDSAKLKWTILRDADLRGVKNLTQAQLDGGVGNANTLLPDLPAPDTGEPYYIWSCSEEEPPSLEPLVHTVRGTIFLGTSLSSTMLTIGEELHCGDRLRESTGTPMAQVAPYPEGHPLEGSD